MYLCDTTVDKANSQLKLKAGRNSRRQPPVVGCRPPFHAASIKPIGFSLARALSSATPRARSTHFSPFRCHIRSGSRGMADLSRIFIIRGREGEGIARKFGGCLDPGSNYVLTLSTPESSGWGNPVSSPRLPFHFAGLTGERRRGGGRSSRKERKKKQRDIGSSRFLETDFSRKPLSLSPGFLSEKFGRLEVVPGKRWKPPTPDSTRCLPPIHRSRR